MCDGGRALILCADGTGNRGGKGYGTNVWELYNAVDGSPAGPEECEQIAFYEDGVGTEDFKLLKMIGGAFGWGLGRNIRELYEFLVYNYRPGDAIYLFGFSRGAFTVRSLSGLIQCCGILDKRKINGDGNPTAREVKKAVREAYDAYRADHRWSQRFYQDWITRTPRCDRIRDRSLGGETIKCIGVWDTVGAIGAPMEEMRKILNWIVAIDFHRTELSSIVENGFQALAIDDERRTFHPVLWNEKESRDALEDLKAQRKARISAQRVEQVWFAGAHSNVGGGYPKQGMARVALAWMLNKAAGCGLRFDDKAVERIREQGNVHDRLYDPRAGVAAYYRYAPRNIQELCTSANAKVRIHRSVFERIDRASQDYAPGNLPRAIDELAFTPDDSKHDDKLEPNDVRMPGLNGTAHRSLLDQCGHWVAARKGLHFLFLVSTLALVALVYLIDTPWADFWRRWCENPAGDCLVDRIETMLSTCTADDISLPYGLPSSVVASIASLLPDFIGDIFQALADYLRCHSVLAWGIVGWFGLLAFLKTWFKRNTNGYYNDVWSKVRPVLKGPGESA